ncbi:MAG: tetratricopeptide repeat protein, partial [Bacteroidia bacterium]
APGENTWINAAYRYFDAFKLSGDSTLQSMMVQQAIESYGKVLAINPDNLDAKTDLGICYAEGSTTPMQGIMLLREVVEKNPGHANAQFNLGILSVRSGQYDKALERFSKVLEIDPKRTLARFMIGRVYAQQGQKEKALAALEQVKKESSDPQLLQEADQLINQIQNNH